MATGPGRRAVADIEAWPSDADEEEEEVGMGRAEIRKLARNAPPGNLLGWQTRGQ